MSKMSKTDKNFKIFNNNKVRVFYLVDKSDKCFEIGADPCNIFDKQIAMFAAFYCMISRASLKARAIARFSKSAHARSKNYREQP